MPGSSPFAAAFISKSGRTLGQGDAHLHLCHPALCDVDKLWETLWDAFKVSLASELDGVVNAYVVAGAPATLWDKPADCAELFTGGVCSTRELISLRHELVLASRREFDKSATTPSRTHPD